MGLAAAVCTGVALATPAMAQTPITWEQHTGATNPLDSVNSGDYAVFVDIDGDGDYDCFENYYISNVRASVKYHKNIGTISNPIFIQDSVNNPLNTTNTIHRPSFVDIDGDGDQDCFAGSYNGNTYIGKYMTYYENTGDSANPIFTERTGILNPLDSINNNAISYNKSISFVDIDNDGDQDCFYYTQTYSGVRRKELSYYENTGSDTLPVFSKNTTTNPLNMVDTFVVGQILFHDMDNDNDLDAYIPTIRQPYGGGEYYENTGSDTLPAFVLKTGTSNPFSNLPTNIGRAFLVDIDNDTDLDCIASIGGISSNFVSNKQQTFFENRTITSIQQLENKIEFSISPNPSTGLFQLEYPISGWVRVANVLGATTYTKKIDNAHTLDLQSLPNGIFFLTIDTPKGMISEKIRIQK